jgi:glycosyltransferase involved in cell wall biosynthesis
MMYSSVEFKGSRDGIAALQIVKEKFPDLRVVLFGTGRRSSRIPRWMNYVRNPPQRQILEEFYNQSSIVVSPSLTEGFALPPAEGAAAGCAIVATDSGGIRDFAEHGVTALLSPPGDPLALADNLCQLLVDDDMRVHLAQAANERMKQFTWTRSSVLLEEFIMDTVQRKYAEPRLAPATNDPALTIQLQLEGD